MHTFDIKPGAVRSKNAPTYLVVMPDAFIAQDLALTIKEYDPTAQVILATSTHQAELMLKDCTSLVIAFLLERPGQFASSNLAQAIALRGGRVVLLGDEAEMSGPTPNWDVLERPFSTETVMTHLGRC